MILNTLHRLVLPCLLVVCLPMLAAPACRAHEGRSGEEAERLWSVVAFSGMYTSRTFGNTVFGFPGDLEKNYIHALGLNRRLFTWPRHFTWEGEALFARHHGSHLEGRQRYDEYVACLLLRYARFPWDRYVNTSVAFGEGMSYTSRLSRREAQKASAETRKLLNYLAVEIGFAHPRYPAWSLVYRIHHRSGIFGLMGGLEGVSDYYCLGIRYRF
jgi:hypothetical protein